MLKLLSQANMEWLRANRRGGGAGPLSFLRETGFDLVSDTTINQVADVESDDVSFVVDDSTDFNTSDSDLTGAGIIWDDQMPDVFNFTSNAANTFSGVTGLAFTHENDDIVQKLYKLTTNFKTFRPSEEYGDGCQVNGVPYRFMQGPPLPLHFSMYDDGTNKFLWLPRGVTGSASILYEKKSAIINSSDDTVDVEEDYEFFLVWRIVQIATVPKEGAEPSQLYILAKGEANKILKEALQDKRIGAYAKVRQFVTLGRYRDPSLTQRVPR